MSCTAQAVHRWAVSGTPISRGLEDLAGLLAFMRAGPWDARRHWRHAVQDPCMRGDAAGALPQDWLVSWACDDAKLQDLLCMF